MKGPATAAHAEPLEPRFLLAAGHLDSRYADAGQLVTPVLGGNDDVATAVAQYRDGRIVVAGQTFISASGKSPLLALTRVLPDGSLDPTFGDAGRLVLDSPTEQLDWPHPATVTLQRNGRILVGVDAGGGVYVCRLNADGSLDRSFGAGGADGDGWVSRVAPQPYSTATVGAVLLRPDGRLLVASSQRILASEVQTSLVLLQYRPDGTPDPTFGNAGVVTAPLKWDSKIGAAALADDGSLFAAGGTQGVGFLMRFDSAGKRDASFDPLAFAPADFPFSRAPIQSLLIQADGRIVLGWKNKVGRLVPGGLAVDPTFGGGRGWVEVDLAENDITATRLQIQKNQRLIVTTMASASADGYVAGAVRLMPDGTSDASFGTAGRAVFNTAPRYQRYNATLLRRDGKVLVVGQDFEHNDFLLDQVDAAGRPDGAFTTPGRPDAFYVSFRGPAGFATAATVPLSDGRQVVVQSTNEYGQPANLRLLRLTAGGVPDLTFGPEGQQQFDLADFASGGPYRAWPFPQPGGKTLLAFGYTGGVPIGTDHLGFTRLNPDGSLDTSFGQRGFVLSEPFAPTAVAADRLGRVVVANNQQLARYLPSGRLDTSFGDHGVARYAAPLRWFYANAVQVDPAGRILIGGAGNDDPDPNSEAYGYALLRLDDRGRPDATFGNRGAVVGTLPTALVNGINNLAVLPDGRIVASGIRQRTLGANASTGVDSDAFLLRLTPGGRLDPTFGEGGVTLVDLGEYDYLDRMLLDRAGRIILAGNIKPNESTPQRVTALRFTPDGRPDPAFARPTPEFAHAADDSDFDALDALTLAPGGDDLLLTGHAGRNLFSVKVLGGGISAYVENRTLHVLGSAAADAVRVWTKRGRVYVSGTPATFAAADLARVRVETFEGDDLVDCSGLDLPADVEVGAGDDRALGGPWSDLLLGGDGNDTLFGGRGNDTLRGNAGNDYLSAGPGADLLAGDAGNDQLVSTDAARDTLDGGSGYDRTIADGDDLLKDTEGLLT